MWGHVSLIISIIGPGSDHVVMSFKHCEIYESSQLHIKVIKKKLKKHCKAKTIIQETKVPAEQHRWQKRRPTTIDCHTEGAYQ